MPVHRVRARLPLPFDARRVLTALAAVGALIGVLALFVKVADLLAERHAGPIDQAVLGEVVEHRAAPLNGLMEGVSTAAELPLMALAGAAAAVLAWQARKVGPLVLLAGAGALSVALATLVKTVVERSRPPVQSALVQETGFSFPSRHTTVGTALLIALAYLLAGRLRTRRSGALVWVGAVGLSALVAASRVYLGVHWATDVTAGLALGASAALAMVVTDQVWDLFARPARHGRPA